MAVRASRLASYQTVVLDAPVSYSVYSAFSFYGTRRGGELPGTWLVAALSALGHEVAAIRQTLYRMEGNGVLQSRSEGRTKVYRLGAAARAEAQAGLEKILSPVSPKWDGKWTLVQFGATTEERADKELLLDIVRAEGFARLGSGLFIHPRDKSARLREAARSQGTPDLITIFRAERTDDVSDADFVARQWDLQKLARRYRSFVKRYAPLEARAGSLLPPESFLLRFALVFEYLEIAWQDPELPAALLPPGWPGAGGQQLAADLYRTLLPEAIAFADSMRE